MPPIPHFHDIGYISTPATTQMTNIGSSSTSSQLYTPHLINHEARIAKLESNVGDLKIVFMCALGVMFVQNLRELFWPSLRISRSL